MKLVLLATANGIHALEYAKVEPEAWQWLYDIKDHVKRTAFKVTAELEDRNVETGEDLDAAEVAIVIDHCMNYRGSAMCFPNVGAMCFPNVGITEDDEMEVRREFYGDIDGDLPWGDGKGHERDVKFILATSYLDGLRALEVVKARKEDWSTLYWMEKHVKKSSVKVTVELDDKFDADQLFDMSSSMDFNDMAFMAGKELLDDFVQSWPMWYRPVVFLR